MSNDSKQSERIYLVVQQGVYRHDIRGVYTSSDKARKAARRAATEDKDSYHEYDVYEATPDEYVEDVRSVPGVPSVSKDTLAEEASLKGTD